jgi:hypothetical protein
MPVFQMPVKSNKWTKIKTLSIPESATSPYQFTMTEHKNYSELLVVQKNESGTSSADLFFGHGIFNGDTNPYTKSAWFGVSYAQPVATQCSEFIISTDAPVVPILLNGGAWSYLYSQSVDLAPKDYMDFYISCRSYGTTTVDIYGR